MQRFTSNRAEHTALGRVTVSIIGVRRARLATQKGTSKLQYSVPLQDMGDVNPVPPNKREEGVSRREL